MLRRLNYNINRFIFQYIEDYETIIIFNKSKTFQYDGLEYLLPKGMEASNESNGIVLIDSNNNK